MVFFLVPLDIFGTTTGFRYDGYSSKKTVFGGIMSIGFFILILLGVIYYSLLYLNGLEFTQINSIIRYPESQVLTFNRNYTIAIKTRYSSGKVDRSDLWTIIAERIIYNQSSGYYQYEKLPIDICTKNDWKNVESQYDFLQLNDSYCINFKDQVIKGNLNAEIREYIQISYILNEEYKNHTKRKWFEDEFNREKAVSTLYFIEDYMVHEDHLTPYISSFINSIYSNLTYSNSKKIKLFLSENELHEHNTNFFWDNRLDEKMMQLEDMYKKASNRPEEASTILSYVFQSSNKKHITVINYISISEICARFGAILQFTYLAIYGVNFLIISWGYEIMTFNRLFDKMKNEVKLIMFNDVRVSLIPQVKTITEKSEAKNSDEQNRLESNENLIFFHKISKNRKILNLKENKRIRIIEPKEKAKCNSHEVEDLSNNINRNVKIVNFLKKVVRNEDNLGNRSFSKLTLCKYLLYKYFSCLFNIKCLQNKCPDQISCHQVYQYVDSYLTEALEIDNIERNYFQLEMLKQVLLTNEQRYYFSKIPLISYENLVDSGKCNKENVSFSEILQLPSSTINTNLKRIFINNS